MAKPHPASEFIERRAWKPLKLDVRDILYEATFFNWFALQERDRVVSDRLRYTLADFHRYFVKTAHEQISNGELVPIAALGLMSTSMGFAEPDNAGFLALDPIGGGVLRLGDDDVHLICASIDELDAQLESEEDMA